MGEVPAVEALEVQLVNATVPFLIVNQLRPLLMRDTSGPRFVVNVTSPEGQFETPYNKAPTHPHSNMAKAAVG